LLYYRPNASYDPTNPPTPPGLAPLFLAGFFFSCSRLQPAFYQCAYAVSPVKVFPACAMRPIRLGRSCLRYLPFAAGAAFHFERSEKSPAGGAGEEIPPHDSFSCFYRQPQWEKESIYSFAELMTQPHLPIPAIGHHARAAHFKEKQKNGIREPIWKTWRETSGSMAGLLSNFCI